MVQLTQEQIQIIHHPTGHHGKVLSVAGSGKTTTLAHRVKHMLDNHIASAEQIQVLTFNREARRQFQERLGQIGLPHHEQPAIDTFHSYAYRIIRQHGNPEEWFGDKEELGHVRLLQAISAIVRRLDLDEDELDAGDAKSAIELWKGALTPHEHAGYQGPMSHAYTAIYAEFERVRAQHNAITFSDFVPTAIDLLSNDQQTFDRQVPPLRHIIIDEYQDVNLSQQRLIEILAQRDADVMAVGDDDQTIYEWRGARSDYILREFEIALTNKPHATYHLTHSFRFGYAIAQASYNVITHNSNRNPKSLIAHDPTVDSRINIMSDQPNDAGSANEKLADQIVKLLENDNATPDSIRVLGRTFAQLNGLTMTLIGRSIPFYVYGNTPFFQSAPCRVLLNYIRVASRIDDPVNDDLAARVANIANKPNRYLGRRLIQDILEQAKTSGAILRDALSDATDDDNLNYSQQNNLANLLEMLADLNLQLTRDDPSPTNNILQWIDQHAGLTNHYRDYYGKGEHSFERTSHINDLKTLARARNERWDDFIRFVDSCDTRLGRPAHQCIQLTTIHRVKGLEFDHVFLPDCAEGHIPVINDNVDPTFHVYRPWQRPQPAEWIENERRLFYVAATRARRVLYIGKPADPPPDHNHNDPRRRIPSRFIEEMELQQTRAVADEITKGAKGQDNKLEQVCQHINAHHKIVRLVKDDYAYLLPPDLRPRIAEIQLSPAERPFLYRQRYQSPSPSTPSQPNAPTLWDHARQGHAAQNDPHTPART